MRLVFVTKQSSVGLVPDGVEVIGFNRFNGDFVARLRAVKADAILDLHANLRTRWIKLLLWNIPSFSSNKQRFGRWIFLQTHKQWIPLKHVVAAMGAVAVTNGYITEDQLLEIAGGVAVLVMVGWSFYIKRNKPE